MILILDSTRQDLPLLRDEFVIPVMNIVKNAGYGAEIRRLEADAMPPGITAVIITGTALKDDEYRKTGLPGWLTSWDGPVLGICAGMQLLVMHAGGELVRKEKIGMAEITVTTDDPVFSGTERFNAWELHRSGVMVPENVPVLATSASAVQGIRFSDRPWYGVLFHPEVRNEWVILNFLKYHTHR